MSSYFFDLDKSFWKVYKYRMNDKDQIKAWLALKKLKPYQLAQKAGISYPAVYQFLDGKRDIRLSTLEKIKKVTNADS